MKLYNEDGEEVIAFTQEEVDAKIKEASKPTAEIQKQLDDKNAEFEKLTKLHEDKSKSYSELLKKNKEYETAEEARQKDTETAYSKSIDEQVKKIAGDDKEYAKALKEQLEREGIKEVTSDASKIEKQVKEAKALTDLALSREPINNPIDGGGSGPINNDTGTRFTETTAGKDAFETLAAMQGTPVEVKSE